MAEPPHMPKLVNRFFYETLEIDPPDGVVESVAAYNRPPPTPLRKSEDEVQIRRVEVEVGYSKDSPRVPQGYLEKGGGEILGPAWAVGRGGDGLIPDRNDPVPRAGKEGPEFPDICFGDIAEQDKGEFLGHPEGQRRAGDLSLGMRMGAARSMELGR